MFSEYPSGPWTVWTTSVVAGDSPRRIHEPCGVGPHARVDGQRRSTGGDRLSRCHPKPAGRYPQSSPQPVCNRSYGLSVLSLRSSRLAGLLLDAVRELSHLVEHAPALGHQLTDLA